MRFVMILGLIALLIGAVCAADQPAQPAQAPQAVKISLSFSDADAAQALIELSQKAQVTVLGDASVKGKVNCSLNEVTAEEALDTICRTNNLEWYKVSVGTAPTEKPSAQKILALMDALKALGNTTIICQDTAKKQETIFVPGAEVGTVNSTPVASSLKLKPVYVVRAVPKPVDPNAAKPATGALSGAPPAEVTAAANQVWNYFSQMQPETQMQVMGELRRMMFDSITPEQRQAMFDRWRQQNGGGNWGGRGQHGDGQRPPHTPGQ